METKKKEKRGGTRKGSGAKPKYNEQTIKIMKQVITTEQGKVVIDETAEISVNDFITDGYRVWKWLDDSSLLGRKKIIYTINFSLSKDVAMIVVDTPGDYDRLLSSFY